MTVHNNTSVGGAHGAGRCPPEDVGGAKVTFANGNLRVNGTKEGDDISLERVDANTVRLTVNGEERLYEGVKRARIDGKKGDDTINLDPNLGIDLKVNGNRGNDSISAQRLEAPERDTFEPAQRAKVRIAGGRGNDEIVSDFDYAKLLGGNGQDTIDSQGNDTKLRGGRGDDVLIDGGFRARLHGGRGKDLLITEGTGATARGGAGDDRFLNDDPAVRIRGGRGKDRVLDTTGTANVRNAKVVDDL
jgi:Ca2+-binding RTX toxin-like protein